MATGLHIDISTGNAFWSPNAFKQDLRADMGGGWISILYSIHSHWYKHVGIAYPQYLHTQRVTYRNPKSPCKGLSPIPHDTWRGVFWVSIWVSTIYYVQHSRDARILFFNIPILSVSVENYPYPYPIRSDVVNCYPYPIRIRGSIMVQLHRESKKMPTGLFIFDQPMI